ncbi:PEGA domain-containing protein, partial [Pyxidicoccus sp. 3LFB2]
RSNEAPRLGRELPPDVSQGIPRSALPPDVSQGISRSSLPAVVTQGPPPRVARHEEEEDEQERPTAAVPALAGRGPDKRVLLFGGAGVAALLVLALLGWALSGPGKGYVLVDLQRVPESAQSKVQVMLDTQQVALEKGSTTLLREVNAGRVMVVVSAPGYKPFTTTVDVAKGKDVTNVQAVLESLTPSAALLLVTQPEDAEVKVDGKVVRAQGKTDAFLNDVPVSGEGWMLEVSAPGYKSQSKQVTVSGGGRAQATIKLEPLVTRVAVKVESRPAGATIFVDGKDLGATTPATVQVPASSKQLLLKLKCHDAVEVDVPDSKDGQELAINPVSLKRQRGCR